MHAADGVFLYFCELLVEIKILWFCETARPS